MTNKNQFIQNKQKIAIGVLSALLVALLAVVFASSAVADEQQSKNAGTDNAAAKVTDVEKEAGQDAAATQTEDGEVAPASSDLATPAPSDLATPAASNEDNPYGIVIDSTTETKKLVEGLEWNKETSTLTATNATVTKGLYFNNVGGDNGVTFVANGTNNFDAPDTTDAPTFGSAAIMAVSTALNITGTGALNLKPNKDIPVSPVAHTEAGKTYSLYVVGQLNINGPTIKTVENTGSEAKIASYGMFVNGDFTVKGSSTLIDVKATNVKEDASGPDTASYGVMIQGKCNILDGAKIVAVAAPGRTMSAGFTASNETIIDGVGTSVKATGDKTTNTEAAIRGGSYGVAIKTALYSENETNEDANFVVSGGSEVVGTSSTGGVYSDGIFCSFHMEIKGAGTTVVATGGESVNRDSNGIEIYDNQLFITDGANVEATAGKAARYSEGIYVEYGFAISGADTIVKAYGAESTATAEKYEGKGGSFGLDTNQNLQPGQFAISDGATVVAVGGTSQLNSTGIYSYYDDLIISNANIAATSGKADTLNSSGITTVEGNVEIKDGSKVVANANTAYLFSVGIECHKNLTITGEGTEVYTNAAESLGLESIGMSSEDGDITISNGAKVEAYAAKAPDYSLGIWAMHNVVFAGKIDVKASSGFDAEAEGCAAIMADGSHLEYETRNDVAYADDNTFIVFDPSIVNCEIENCKEVDEEAKIADRMTQIDYNKPISIVTNSGNGDDDNDGQSATGSASTGSASTGSASTGDATPYALALCAIAVACAGLAVARKRLN